MRRWVWNTERKPTKHRSMAVINVTETLATYSNPVGFEKFDMFVRRFIALKFR
jgi:hypothetical protein